MKVYVIYDSNFGNTKIIADTIAQELGGTSLSIDNVKSGDLVDIDLLIVGSPINAWRPTKKVSHFLNSLSVSSLSNVRSAAFDTRVKIFISGNAAKKISKALSEKGATIIAEPKGFYVKDNEGPLLDGEISNAKKWANDILQKMTTWKTQL